MRRLAVWLSVVIAHASFVGYCAGRGWPWVAPLVVQGLIGWLAWQALEDFCEESVDNARRTWYDVPSDPDSPDLDGRTE